MIAINYKVLKYQIEINFYNNEVFALCKNLNTIHIPESINTMVLMCFINVINYILHMCQKTISKSIVFASTKKNIISSH